jgi:hypothetical protein
MERNIKEFCLLCDGQVRPDSFFLNRWLITEGKIPADDNRYSGYIRNSISSPLDGFAAGVFSGIAEYWRTDRPVDKEYRLIPAVEGIDMGKSVSFLAEEHVIREGRGAVKFMSLLRRKPGLSPAEFSKAWCGNHAVLVQSVDEVWRLFRGYRQNHIIPGTCRQLDGSEMTHPYDGIVEIWFDSLPDLQQAMMSERYREIVRPDEETFVDLPNTRMFSTETIVFPANSCFDATVE